MPGLPHQHTFAEWAASAGVDTTGLLPSAVKLAERAWAAGQDQAQRMTGIMLDDLGGLLHALGLDWHQRAMTPHEWMGEVTRIVAGLMTAAPACQVTCTRCGQILDSERYPPAPVFRLLPHNCPVDV